MRRVPEAPIGWPMATAPPSTLKRSSGTWKAFWTAHDAEAKASLCSKRSTSLADKPVLAKRFLTETMGASMTHSGFVPEAS